VRYWKGSIALSSIRDYPLLVFGPYKTDPTPKT
jgi:hypothetical protein